MSTAHEDIVRRLKQQEEAAQAALTAQRAKVRAAQAKLRHAAQQERLAHQHVMGRLAEEAGLATLDLDTLRQAFTVLGHLAQRPSALVQWLAQWRACDPEPPLTDPDPSSAAQGTENGTATRGSAKECPAPRFSGEKR